MVDIIIPGIIVVGAVVYIVYTLIRTFSKNTSQCEGCPYASQCSMYGKKK